MERTRDLIALHRSLGEVAAHVAAEGVEDVDRPVAATEHHQLLAECAHRVRLAIAEVTDQPQAMPTSGEPGRRRPSFDLTDLDIGL
jgi:hypothetical protein